LVENRIRTVVHHRRACDPNPDDPFRGLYLGEEAVDRLLDPHADPDIDDGAARAAAEAAATAAEESGTVIRLREMARTAGLTELDCDLLVICLLPDLDSRFERLYGYLNDDVSRRRATIDLALTLAGVSPLSVTARGRLSPGAPLIDHGLVEIEETSRPLLTRSLRVPDRVTAHLLGDNTFDTILGGVVSDFGYFSSPLTEQIAAALSTDCTLVYVRDQFRGAGAAAAASAVVASGRADLGVDAGNIGSAAVVDVVVAACREALLRSATMVFAHIDDCDDAAATVVRTLSRSAVPVVIVGRSPWNPLWCEEVPLIIEAPRLSESDRLGLWAGALAETPSSVNAVDIGGHFALAPVQVARAVASAQITARAAGRPMTAEHLRGGARSQNAAGLERLARRITPAVGWLDLVVPAAVSDSLHDLSARARHRDRVLTEWGMRRGGGRGRGVIGLFAGESGTGKTMAAEVLAGDLGLEMYVVSLSSVVSKWVGETEKNLDRIFDEAESVNAVIVFDEADALFGKRSEVRDAQDRYANIETAYLLQRMEAFDGLAVLTTNLRSNLDDAFTRRLDAVVDFPQPDSAARLDLWRRCLQAPVPVDVDIDLHYCAETFTLAGGNIRSASVTAGYRAAAEDRAITTADVVTAVAYEYRKLGRLIGEREFGGYLRGDGSAETQRSGA
jgi:hypothetical protein